MMGPAPGGAPVPAIHKAGCSPGPADGLRVLVRGLWFDPKAPEFKASKGKA